jgi:hypothetical protein
MGSVKTKLKVMKNKKNKKLKKPPSLTMKQPAKFRRVHLRYMNEKLESCLTKNSS